MRPRRRVQTRLQNPPLGADWLTPRLAAHLHDYERKAINCRTRLYGRHLGQFVCQSVPSDVLSLVVDHAEMNGTLEHGIVLYPGLEPGGWPNKDPDELRHPRPWWHWWIRLEDGTIVDVASSQFGQRSPLVIPPGHPLQRFYVPEGDEWLEEAGRYGLKVNPLRCDYGRVAFSLYQGSQGKKRTAVFSEPGRRTVHFGAQGYEDYTMHQDPERRRRYLERHGRGREDWDRCDTAGSLSRWILWGGSADREANERAFRKRFGLRKNPSPQERGMNLPSLETQRRIAVELDRVTAQADALLANARRSVALASELRSAHLHQVFGSAQEVHRRLNPVRGLGGLISLRVGGPADFYVQRSGGEGTVGRPFREAFPESKGGARRGPGNPRHHIGVTVTRPDVLDPRFLFYVAEYAWRSGIYRRLCHGTLQLQHLRLKDVSCGLGAVISGQCPKKNPVSGQGRYRFVTDCIHSTGPDIGALVDGATKISQRTFRRKLAPGEWGALEARLNYDRHFPLSRDQLVGYFRSTYRGVPAVFMTWSGIEQVFTLDGEQGPSIDPGFVNTDLRAKPGSGRGKWGRFEL